MCEGTNVIFCGMTESCITAFCLIYHSTSRVPKPNYLDRKKHVQKDKRSDQELSVCFLCKLLTDQLEDSIFVIQLLE